MLVLAVLEKNEESKLKCSQEQQMEIYEGARVELTSTQINKLKSAAKNETRTTLRISKRNIQDDELS